MLSVGQPAPEFEAKDQHGRSWTLGGLRATGPVVLYFYPKDGTAVCTRQACMFRDIHGELHADGVQVVGVSADGEASHRDFAAAHSVPFPLLSDEDKRIARAFGITRPLGLPSKRVSFVVDKAGIIRGTFHHELSAEKHITGVRELLRELAGR